MKAYVSIAPTGLKQTDVTRDMVLKELTSAGVQSGIDEEAVAKLLEAIESKNASFRTTVASGRALVAATAATHKPLIRGETLVEAGTPLIQFEGGTPAVTGLTVTGREIEPLKRSLENMAHDAHVTEHDEDRTWRAQCAGYAKIEGLRVLVDPLVHIAEDQMSAVVRIHPIERQALIPNAEIFQRMLLSSGVLYGTIDQAHTLFVQAVSKSEDAPEQITIARSSLPIRGEDEVIRFVLPSMTEVGLSREDGRIDYRQQQTMTSVKAHDLVAMKTPAGTGTPGSTVTGQPIAAQPGNPCRISIGENLSVSADGTRITATLNGMVLRRNERFWVTDRLDIPGDVDFSTGNLDCAFPIQIRGTVRSTFSAKSQGTIQVGESIEDAVVESAQSIEVKRGIIHRRMGAVSARGSIHAAYAQHANLHAGESIFIRDSAVQCQLAAQHSIVIHDGKGVLMGGQTIAGQCVEVRVAGSEMNVDTEIRVGVDFKAIEQTQRQLQPIDARLADIALNGGTAFLEYATGSKPAPADERIQSLLKAWQAECKKRIALIEERERVLSRHAKPLDEPATVVIRQWAYPGVDIRIGPARLIIREKAPGGRYMLDPDTGQIRCDPVTG